MSDGRPAPGTLIHSDVQRAPPMQAANPHAPAPAPPAHTGSGRPASGATAGDPASGSGSLAREPRPYRRDIDGLRAVAVGGVLLFHAGVPGVEGGFVGVDVFFVISGYLITQLLLSSRAKGLAQQLGEFYLRRARRILPALLVMLLVVTLLAVALLLPQDLRTFGRYLAATPALLANVAAAKGVDYFATAAPQPALLHLWSIAVEEQFYLAYPLALLTVTRILPRWRLAALVVVATLSLLLCIWAAEHRPVANFYLPPSRAWELLLGAIVVLWRRAAALSAVAASGVSLLALAVIAATMHGYRTSLVYPSLYALPPCLATAALLAVGEDARCISHRVLGWQPLVATGLISYSLYLWHLPLFTLYRYYRITAPGAPMIGVLLLLTFAIAALSWRYIEQPIRRGVRLRSGRAFLWSAAAASALAAACGGALWLSGGWPHRFAAPVLVLAQSSTARHPDARRCTTLPLQTLDASTLCRFGSRSPEAVPVLVWGDSHATALLPAYESLAAEHGLALYFAASSACRPLLGVAWAHGSLQARANCAAFNAAMLRSVAQLRPRVVVLNAFWSHPDLDFIAADGASASQGPPSLATGLAQTVERVAASGSRVCIVLDPPQLNYQAPYALAMARLRGIDDSFITVSLAAAHAQFRDAEDAIRALPAQAVLAIVDPKAALCASGICQVRIADRPLYTDADHLAVAGAQYVSGVIDGCFRELH